MLVTREQCGLKPPRNINRNIADAPMNTLHYGGNALGGFPWNHGRCASVWRAWQDFHLSKGWADIAYTAGVCIHGDVFVGRWFGVRTAANGTNDGNQRSLAACYIAGAGEPLTDAAKEGFLDYLELSREQGKATKEVRSHRTWKSTACPGDPIDQWIKDKLPSPAPQPTEPTEGDDDVAVLIQFKGTAPAGTPAQDPKALFLLAGRVKSRIENEDEFWDHVGLKNVRMKDVNGKQVADLQLLDFGSSSDVIRARAIRVARMPVL